MSILESNLLWIPYLSFWSSAIILDQLLPKIPSLQKYKYHQTPVINQVSKKSVFITVLFQNIIFATLTYLSRKKEYNNDSIGKNIFKVLCYIAIDETYSYWYHYHLHKNVTLYKYFHKYHHKMIEPNTYGSQYSSALDVIFGILLPNILAKEITQISEPWLVGLLAVRAIKTNYDHSGYVLPFPLDPFNCFLFPNKTEYHLIHHDVKGRNCNFSGGFTNFWDRVVGTFVPKIENPSV
jgi:sterol desaturase/sphingolipid hydroxylase (fatty acid hydroxylase superfamily)